MSTLLGKTIRTISGTEYLLTEIVGQGAQGIVYKESSGEHLIKMYFNTNEIHARKQIDKIKWLSKQNYPDRFIMPIDIIEKPYVGYVMKRVKGHFSLNKLLIPSKGLSFSDWYNDFSGGLRRRLYLGFQIAQAFNILHKDNRAYCDISGNNVLVVEDKAKASVCMIDIDNLYIPGTDKTSILGTARYMAPEILNKQMQPDIFTDDFSLAVLIFELLKVGHPYVGDVISDGTPEMESDAYKGDYPYVDDEDNTFNRSNKMLPSEVVINPKLRELFKKTFLDGKMNRMSRATAFELSVACLEASNVLIKCKECNSWFFPTKKVDSKFTCPWCDKENDTPCYLSFRDSYKRYDKNTAKKEVKQKVISSYLLRESVNSITDNYVFRSKSEIEVKECFRIAFGTDGKYYLLNPAGNEMFYKKHNLTGRAIQIGSVEKQALNRGDMIYFGDPSVFENEEDSPISKMKVLRYAIIM